MGNWIRVKHKHVFYNLNVKRTKSWEKYKKAMAWYTDILKKQKKEWMQKWVAKTRIKAEARFKKFWITRTMFEAYLNGKWLSDLLS